MARFEWKGLDPRAAAARVSEDGKTVFMNKKGTISLSTAQADVSIHAEGWPVRTFHCARTVISAPHGAKLLPYFKRGEECFVVMVEQFRLALPGQTIEPAGGEADSENVCAEMAREFLEETRIEVFADDIDLVFEAYIQPSLLSAKAYGGIVEILESEIPEEILCEGHSIGEFTVVAVKPLREMLRARALGGLTIDLETWILLDAVAEAVGLIKRLY